MMAMMALIPPWLKAALISVLAGGSIAAFSFGLGYYRGDLSGFHRAETAQLKADMKAERERTKDDAKLRDLSNYDFCTVAVRRRGLPIDQCKICAGLRANSISPAGLVALIKADRAGAERVEGNDENGKRRGSWK